MTWTLVLLLAAGAYACKVVGLVLLGGRTMPPRLERCLALIPAALIAALVAKDTFSVGQTVQLDARAVGVGAAVLAVWRGLPFVAVIVLAAGSTALVRLLASG